MDLFEDLFGSSDNDKEFLGFEFEGEHERDEDGVSGDEDEDDDLDERTRVENLIWSRKASLVDAPDFETNAYYHRYFQCKE